MAIGTFLNLSGLVETPAYSQTSMGGNTKTWSTKIAALPCTLAKRKLSEVGGYGKETVVNLLRLCSILKKPELFM